MVTIQKIYEIGIIESLIDGKWTEYIGAAVKINIRGPISDRTFKFKFRDIDRKFKKYEDLKDSDFKQHAKKFIDACINSEERNELEKFIFRSEYDRSGFKNFEKQKIGLRLVEYKQRAGYSCK